MGGREKVPLHLSVLKWHQGCDWEANCSGDPNAAILLCFLWHPIPGTSLKGKSQILWSTGIILGLWFGLWSSYKFTWIFPVSAPRDSANPTPLKTSTASEHIGQGPNWDQKTWSYFATAKHCHIVSRRATKYWFWPLVLETVRVQS